MKSLNISVEFLIRKLNEMTSKNFMLTRYRSSFANANNSKNKELKCLPKVDDIGSNEHILNHPACRLTGVML